MIKKACLALLFCIVFINCEAQRQQKFDIAFLLDLSGSTNGLLNDFRNNYYFMLNELQSMKPAPEVRFAVITYGRPSFGRNNNYVKIAHNFTQDFDLIQYDLIQLRTSVERGNQYVGDALLTAIRDLQWSEDNSTIKLIYLIGNGMTNTNMAINNEKVAEEAVEKNIKVNAFYVTNGSKFLKELIGWKSIAENTNGIYADAGINRKQPVPQLVINYEELNRINNDYNSSFITFNETSAERLEMNNAIDKYHKNVGGYSFEDRVFYKTTKYYENSTSSWDLISAGYKQYIDVLNLDSIYLPQECQKMDKEKLKVVINFKRVERNKFKNQALNFTGGKARHEVLNEKLAEMQLDKTNTLARVIINTLRDVAEINGIKNP